MGINIKKLTLLCCIQSLWVILILICAALPSRTGARLLRATSEDDTAGQNTYRTIVQKTTPISGVTPDEVVTDGPKADKSTAENTKLSGVSQGSTMSRTGKKVELQLQRHDPLGLGSCHIFKPVARKTQHRRRLQVPLPPYQPPQGPPTESIGSTPPPTPQGGPLIESTREP
ncbi:hypothetical protein O6H91_11G116800 [Diphasiastrum complanatum]|uniref:Uncharacterized protein n=2 Tax=Diphasiastrum complanatum TaxID=34168 RepID=A0ACC2CD37_DIPCM|nr:hypothetical protein O6H91_11G116800 [Diphasiastrum complanatum]KAJ7539952.1 hypothetical protein O6H91_11G116800 [Diphasiastrum complanatum]